MVIFSKPHPAQHDSCFTSLVKVLRGQLQALDMVRRGKTAARRLADMRTRLSDLVRIEAVLAQILSQCDARGSTVSCPLIASPQQGR